MQLSPIERYALNFVEATGDVWTAENLRMAEAELEAQKKEWEANRLAAIQKQEEELQKLEQVENDGGDEYESDEDVMLTYSREDATNQVNKKSNKLPIMRSKKIIINKRLAKVKEQDAKAIRQQNKQSQISRKKKVALPSKRPLRKRPNVISSSKSKTSNGKDSKKRKIDISNRRVTRSSPTKSSPNKSSDKKDLSNSTNSEGDDEEESENETSSLKNGKSIENSNVSDEDETTMTECSLDVMLHDTTTNSTNCNKSDSENLSSKETHFSDYDEKDGDPLHKNKLNILDVNSPRTRSRGSVKINLWTLDESPILPPSRGVVHNKKDSSNADDVNELISTPKNHKTKIVLSSSAGSPKKKNINSNGKQKLTPSCGNNSSLIDRWVVKTPRTNSSPSPIPGRRITRLSSTFNNTS